ncbi:MAG TPA: phosphoserine phosphatase, partial [Chitinophagaceae bacterium]|nr:phosphoserine phosphatase [Chitinophagaceae bacterium]
MASTLILDFDSTIVQTETLDELALLCLQNHPQAGDIKFSIHTLTQQAMNGELDFETALQQRISLS